MTAQLHRRTGFEIELMAPHGLSRRTLAVELAGRCGGRIHPVWHFDSEPSLVPGLGRFLHLTQGFEVRRADGSPLCTLVDDITLLAGLDPRAAPPPGWWRVLSDDPRVLRLLARHSDPGGTLGAALDATAQLWGSVVQRIDDVYRLDDLGGVTIALAAPQGGERERACEIVTPPLTGDHEAALEELLGPARELGFTVPVEAAVHPPDGRRGRVGFPASIEDPQGKSVQFRGQRVRYTLRAAGQGVGIRKARLDRTAVGARPERRAGGRTRTGPGAAGSSA